MCFVAKNSTIVVSYVANAAEIMLFTLDVLLLLCFHGLNYKEIMRFVDKHITIALSYVSRCDRTAALSMGNLPIVILHGLSDIEHMHFVTVCMANHAANCFTIEWRHVC